MKTLKSIGSFMVLALVVLTSCAKMESVITNDGGADFSVENVTTGGYVVNKGIVFSLGCKTDALDVRPGDELVLRYIPENRIKKYDLDVYFTAFNMGENKIESPYTERIKVEEYNPGLHYIRCEVEYSRGGTRIYESGGVWVRIN